MVFPAPRKLYITLCLGCLLGYAWLFISSSLYNGVVGGCIMKSITHIPCPSCGTTRSVLSLLHGDIKEALFWNPIGLIVFTIMAITPCWILFDIVSRQNTLYRNYLTAEHTLKKKKFALLFALLIVSNWIWNIYKEL